MQLKDNLKCKVKEPKKLQEKRLNIPPSLRVFVRIVFNHKQNQVEYKQGKTNARSMKCPQTAHTDNFSQSPYTAYDLKYLVKSPNNEEKFKWDYSIPQ